MPIHLYQTSAHHMPMIASGSVHTIVTSPPFMGLRAYAGEQSIEWPTVTYSPMPGLPPIRVQGCEPGCKHEWVENLRSVNNNNGLQGSTLTSGAGPEKRQAWHDGKSGTVASGYCRHCHGWRGALGLEESIERYIGHLVLCLREWHRILRKDGTLWCNLADSYSTPKEGNTNGTYGKVKQKAGVNEMSIRKSGSGLKPKNLMMIPARFALAAQAEGWILRSDLIWSKPNPMPESVTDRATKSHEYIFMLAKSERYFWDAEAVREPATYGENRATFLGGTDRLSQANIVSGGYAPPDKGMTRPPTTSRNLRSVLHIATQPTNHRAETVHRVHVSADAVSDDTMCKVSLDCPVHGDLGHLYARVLDGVRATFLLYHSQDIRSRHAPTLSSGSVPTDQRRGAAIEAQNSGLLRLPYFLSATDRSRQTNKKGRVPVTSSSYTPSGQTDNRTGDIQDVPALFELSPYIDENNTWEGGCSGDHTNQTDCRNVDSERLSDSSLMASWPPSCTCELYHEITESTSHFATFPERIPEIAILAGTSARGCCPQCGAGWVRCVEDTPEYAALKEFRRGTNGYESRGMEAGNRFGSETPGISAGRITTGWQPSCECNAGEPIPAIVCDVFHGSGTSARVALRLGRSYIGCDIAETYLTDITAQRLGDGVQMEMSY